MNEKNIFIYYSFITNLITNFFIIVSTHHLINIFYSK